MNKTNTKDIKEDIINTAMPNIAFDGLNWEMICNSAEQAGYSKNTAESVFIHKMKDVLQTISEITDKNMLEALEAINPDDLPIRQRIKIALLERFKYLSQHRDALTQSMQYWIIPSNKPRAARIVWQSADTIWSWAGDTSKDYNHYTKRILLSGIITATTLYLLNNKECSDADLEDFIDRRIENVMTINKFTSRFKK
ncbi:MAG: COQ9 family protein [Micavibrio sp.]|mgnify:CR=1 FL=1|nr:COQ9 family protein [Micavibrio sp.]|tara:strand:- start:1460 stop:2050 length:591 start_codon:yes stop_codon:yes gene_type:complete